MTLTNQPVPRTSRDITVAYLRDLLLNAGFIDDRQRTEIEAPDRQFRLAQREVTRAEEDASRFRFQSSFDGRGVRRSRIADQSAIAAREVKGRTGLRRPP